MPLNVISKSSIKACMVSVKPFCVPRKKHDLNFALISILKLSETKKYFLFRAMTSIIHLQRKFLFLQIIIFYCFYGEVNLKVQ